MTPLPPAYECFVPGCGWRGNSLKAFVKHSDIWHHGGSRSGVAAPDTEGRGRA
jgi:hypothetical protein